MQVSPALPSLEVAAGAKPLPTAFKAPPPTKAHVARVARPIVAQIAVPKVGTAPQPPAGSVAQTKRSAVSVLENTAAKMTRLLAPSPVHQPVPALPTQPGSSSQVARNLQAELDRVSDGQRCPLPDSSLVFPSDAAAFGPPAPLGNFTPAPSEVMPVDSDQEPITY